MSSRIHTVILPTLLAVLIGLAMLPYGSVTPWAQTLVIFLALAIFSLTFLSSPSLAKPRIGACFVLLVILAVWLGYQYVFVLAYPAERVCFKLALSWWLTVFATVWTTRALCADRRAIWTLAIGIAVVGTAQAIIGLLGLNMELGPFSKFVKWGRAAGSFSSGNSFGGFVILALLSSAGLATAELPSVFRHVKRRGIRLLHSANKRDYRILGGLAVLVAQIAMMLAVILSGSRGAGFAGIIALTLALVWINVSRDAATNGFRRMPLIFFCVTVIVVLLGFGGAYRVAEHRYSALSNAASVSLPRTMIWRGVVNMITDSPLGVGLGGFSARFPQYQPRGFSVSRVRHAHNDYLELLSELGIPGAALLFLTIAVLLLHSFKYLLRRHKDRTTWLRRLALLAVVAGLIHAAVDFNITSRPAISILFAALLGMATSRSGQDGHRKKSGGLLSLANIIRRGEPLVAKTLILIVCGITLAPFLVLRARDALSSFLVETSSPTIGRAQTLYFWLKPKDLSPQQAVHRIEKAAKIFPSNPRIHMTLAQAQLGNLHRKRRTLTRQLLAGSPHLTETEADHHVTLALRQDEAQVLAKARLHVEAALREAPYDVSANAHLTALIGGLAQLSYDEREYQSRLAELMAQAHKARSLGPNDVSVHRLILRGISRACCGPYAPHAPLDESGLRAMLLDVGRHMISLDASDLTKVLVAWETAGIDPLEAVPLGSLPIDILWLIYQHYDDAGDGPAALMILDKLQSELQQSTIYTSHPRSPKVIDQAQRDEYMRLAARAQCKWFLRTQALSAYTARRLDRDAALRTRVRADLSNAGRAPRKETGVHLRALEELWDDPGLDPAHMRKYYEMARQHGVNDTTCIEIACPIALFGHRDPELALLLKSTGGQFYAHRLALLEAEQDIRKGLFPDARTTLLSQLETLPRDPDTYALMIKHAPGLKLTPPELGDVLHRLSAVSPHHFVGMQFMGGRGELTGLSIDPERLQTYWRFRSPVPSDLQVLVLFRDADGETHFPRSVDFAKAGGLSFGTGTPTLGRVFQIDIPLPHERVSLSSRLIVGLRRKSTGRWLQSSEGLSYCEIYNWSDLIYAHDTLRDQEAPARGVREALGIQDAYRAPNFSHNLYRVYDTETYFPVLDGQRKTTQPPTWQPCLSASGIVAHAVAAARTAFQVDPHLQMFALGINDGQAWCECDACRDLCPDDQREFPASQRWWSEPYWSFINAVATQLQETHPGKRIGALAYSNVANPPSFALASNVTVYVCQDAGSHFDPLERKRDRAQIDQWVNVCSDVGKYGYAGLASWIFPRYCRNELAADIRHAADLDISRFYLESSWVQWIDGPLPWIVKRLLDDPTLDPETLQRQFCDTAYGPASDIMNAYFNFLQEVWSSAPAGKWFDGLYQLDEQAKRYPPAVREKMRSFIQDAEALAAGTPAILRRISAVSAPLAIAEAFASERDLMQQLASPVQSMADIAAKEALLPQLRDAIVQRTDLIESLDKQPWAPSLKRALSASRVEPTIDRWNRKQQTLIEEVTREITLVHNAAGNLLPASQQGSAPEADHE